MNSEQMAASKSILSGINYLADEAQSSGIGKIARILKLCARDINIVMAEGVAVNNDASILLDDSVLSAVQFLRLFSTAKDAKVRRGVIEHIDRMEQMQSQEQSNVD